VTIPIGLALAPPAPDVPNALDDLVARACTAAASGVASLWLGQLFDIDALTSLAVIGAAVPDIELGTAITPVYPLHPIALSSQAQTVQAAVRGRLRLGLGTSHRESVEQRFGYSFDRPARYLREYLQALTPLLHDGGVDVRGETVVADTTGWSARVPGSTPPQVLVAALGPAMLRVAGELADGTVTWLAGPRTLEQHIVPALTQAAAGRPAPQVVAGLPVCVTNDPDSVKERAARSHLAFYDQFSAYRTVLAREGVRSAIDVAIIGDEDYVERRIRELREAGATEFLANPWGFTTSEEHDRTVEFLGALTGGRPRLSVPPPARSAVRTGSRDSL
jgi:F420-dependent oxidoreductase-like protein